MSYSRGGSQKSDSNNERQRTQDKMEHHSNKSESNKLQYGAKTNEYDAINFDGSSLMPKKQKCFAKADEFIMK